MTGLTQCIHRAAQVRGNQIATVFGDRKRSWREVADRVARFAGALRKLGAGRGARVAVLGLNSDRYFECFFSIPWAGCEIVPLNIRWSVAENARALNDSGATFLLFDDAFTDHAARLGDEAKGVVHRIYFGDRQAPTWAHDFETLTGNAGPAADAGLGGDAVFGVFYTGGTTGFPKGVVLSHRGIWSSALSAALEISMDGRSRYLHCAPMFHMADICVSMAATIAGAAHAFIPAFNAELALKIMAQERISHVILVPAMIRALLASSSLPGIDLSCLKRMLYGAAPMPETVLAEAMQKFSSCGFISAYGQTELSPLVSLLLPEDHVKGKIGSVGRAAPCSRVKIIDDAGNETPRGTVGQIAVSGPQVMLGYLNMPELTAATLVDGWVLTGDVAYMDEDGFIFIVDRIKDMIVTGGENVFSAEVENAIASHPVVADVAVFGIPSEQWGEQVHALVIAKPGAQVSEKDIIGHCKALIAGYKCPKSVGFRKEPFPLSGAGKVLKTELRKPYWEGRERKVA